MTLAEVLEATAAELEAVTATELEAGTTIWSVAGTPIAAVAGTTAEFRLDPTVARAALGTPDTAPSPRGADWVAFSPRELDRLAVDRATAWLASAYRRTLRPK